MEDIESDYEWTPLGRLVARMVGSERLTRLLEGPPRCLWTSPLLHDQCARMSGHKGVCITERVHTDKTTGRKEAAIKHWYGINYD